MPPAMTIAAISGATASSSTTRYSVASGAPDRRSSVNARMHGLAERPCRRTASRERRMGYQIGPHPLQRRLAINLDQHCLEVQAVVVAMRGGVLAVHERLSGVRRV